MRNAALRSQMLAELVALGFMVFVIALVSAIGIAFVHMFGLAVRRRRRRQGVKRAHTIVGLTNA